MQEALLNNDINKLFDNPRFEEIFKNAILGVCEPKPVSFTSIDEKQVDKVGRGIELASGERAARFRTPVNRRSFLAACLDYTCDESIEHLIVGYGTKWRSTTKIDSLHHVVGKSGSVMITEKIRKLSDQRLFGETKGEVLMFHNHPNWLLNVIADNLPVASSTDRQTASKMKLNPVLFWKNLFGNGDVKFYLGENGFVKEFKLPPFDQILNFLTRVRVGKSTAQTASK